MATKCKNIKIFLSYEREGVYSFQFKNRKYFFKEEDVFENFNKLGEKLLKMNLINEEDTVLLEIVKLPKTEEFKKIRGHLTLEIKEKLKEI